MIWEMLVVNQLSPGISSVSKHLSDAYDENVSDEFFSYSEDSEFYSHDKDITVITSLGASVICHVRI
jgi:hypothetical protein